MSDSIYEVSTVLRASARSYYKIDEGEYMDSAVFDTQSKALHDADLIKTSGDIQIMAYDDPLDLGKLPTIFTHPLGENKAQYMADRYLDVIYFFAEVTVEAVDI